MCTTDLKAIDTEYKGLLLRSRLEARWAVTLDALGCEYVYEDEGFDLGDGIWYLPDFWLPYHEWWLEIKGQEPTGEEIEKARRLAEQSGYPVAILSGQVGDYTVTSFPGGWGDEVAAFEILLMGYARLSDLGISSKHKDMPLPPPMQHSLDDLLTELEGAYKTGRQARFEYGG